ncbi:hypothetical protein BCV69DRAFT_279473 [Microstroma glucosiphilum]|uniref:Nucleoporin n=1 Tax=Pseudomicrostroma glucosiphilum TaxID=1684307 RepID=A0A316UEA9_9BASI|nr:hypothetical protein BCV69DRAFT_279473 [Pseudomicrostroma glucosiphilum]PWN23540.1 hypothetical protein BCV69DRAFT_279473 [Pseudomicrostroma glucosiphilum]
MATTFVPSQYVRLHGALHRATTFPASSSSTGSASNDWYIAVDGLRNELVDLGRVKGADDAEKREIEGGKITLAGTTHTLNSDFASLTLLLSASLNASPRYCASLLQAALSSRSRWPSRSPIEIALILYQRERWALTEAWKQLVQAAVTLPQEESLAKRKLGLKVSQALQALLTLKVHDSKTNRDVTLPRRLLLEIDSLKSRGAEVEKELRSPPTNAQRRLPDEVQLDRLAAIRQERRAWGHVLYLLCISGMLVGEDLLAIAQWLSKVAEDEQTGTKEELMPYVLAALLSGLETSTKNSLEGMAGPGLPDLLEDRSALSQLNSLINSSKWSDASLQAVVQLQWCLLLVQVVKHDPSLGNELHVTDDSVTQAVLKAVQKGDAFVYVVVRLLGWRQRLLDSLEGVEPDDAGIPATTTTSTNHFGGEGDDEVDAEFQQYLLSSIYSLLLGTSRTFLTLLRKIQRQEEDAAFSASRAGSSQSQRRYDLEALLDGIALVVRGDVPLSLPFWLSPDGRRSRFLLWAVELREEGHQRALLDLLSSMASGGGEGAWQAHTLLSNQQEESVNGGLISWNRLWDWMGYYIEGLRGKERAGMPPGEAALLRSFLRLLKSVVAGSYPAREALLAVTLTSNTLVPAMTNPNPFGIPSSSSSSALSLQQSGTGTTVLQRLFSLYVCPVPVELKSSLLDSLAAFAKEPPAGSVTLGRTAKVRQDLWALLESSGTLVSNKAAPSTSFGSSYGGFRPPPPQQSGGVRYELEQVEGPSGFYPATTSFLSFLAVLVVPNGQSPAGRSSGDIQALVSDLPAASSTGQLVPTTQPLGVPSPSIPFDLGLEKYIAFVVDVVLLPSLTATNTSQQREFATYSEKWRLVAASLQFLDRCLSAFDLVSLEKPVGPSGARGAEDRDTVLRLGLHPGFGVMKRLMSSSRLLREIVAVLTPNLNGAAGLDPSSVVASSAAGFEIVDSPAGKKAVYLSTAVRTALRIVLKALKGQDLFMQVLLPTLAGLAEPETLGQSGTTATGLPPGIDLEARIGQSGSYTAIDAKLLQEYEAVVQIALYINSNRDDLALLSVQLLGEIARSSAFSEVDRFADGVAGVGRKKMNRLVGLLEMTDESGRVKDGVVRRLDLLAESDDGDGVVSALLLTDDSRDGEGDELLQGTTPTSIGGNEAVCQAILDLLLLNVANPRSGHNIAHLLLGFDLRVGKADEQVIPNPGPDNPRGALHSILDLLQGSRSVDEDGGAEDGDADLPTLLDTHPGLAERSLLLLVRLATHPFTTSSTLRYLRTQEDFWGHQLRRNMNSYSVPVERGSDDTLDEISASRLARGSVVYPDGQSVATSVDALVASLRIRRHLLTGIALEVHGLVAAGMYSQAARLVGALYGSGLVIASPGDEGRNADDDNSVGDFLSGKASSAIHNEQSGNLLLELLHSFDFEWHDERDGVASNLSILGDLDISQARSDSASREFDVGKSIGLLAFARRELERQGELSEARKRAAFDREAAIVLQYVSARNAHRVIAAARRTALTSWRNVHDLVLSHASILFRPEARATVVFDCLTSLLPKLEGPAPEEDPALADLAAGAILALLTSLRRHRAALGAAAQLSGAADLLDELPVDRLMLTLRALVGALLRSGTSISARGNLYSALINFLQLARTAAPRGDEPQGQSGDASFSVAGTDIDDGASAIFSVSGSTVGGEPGLQPSLLDVRTSTFLATQAERLVSVVARDALDAPDVWRTVAFTLLDKLYALEALTNKGRGGNSRGPLVLDILSRGGFMKSFVARLRAMDVELQEVLRPDPSSLNALYVYESILAFFGRLSQTREGAERLLEARLFDVFAQADALASRPEEDQGFVDLESFLPAATERYGALLLPALQVSVSTVNSAATSQRSRAPVIGFGGQRQPESSHASHSALQQALALLNTHRDAFLAVLKAATSDTTSLATIEQAHLIVALFLQILPITDDDALSPPQPLSAFHSAVLALAAAFLHTTAWRSRVVPFTESEREDEATAAPALKSGGAAHGTVHDDLMNVDGQKQIENVFDLHASQMVARLVSLILAYLEAASETHGRVGNQPNVRPCFTSALVVPQPFSVRGQYDAQEERRSLAPPMTTGRLASVPSLGVALASMDEVVASLEADLQTAEGIKSMLENSENVRLEEWDRVVEQSLLLGATSANNGASAARSLGDLGLGQRKSIATRQLHAHLALLRSQFSERLDLVDLLLVLIHRHFGFYLSLSSSSTGRATTIGGAVDDFAAPWRASSAGAAGASRQQRSTPGGGGLDSATSSDALLREGAHLVQLALERLGRVLIALTSQDAPLKISAPRERSAFLELVGRKLQTLLLVRREEEGEA